MRWSAGATRGGKPIETERAALRPLPPKRTTDYKEAIVTGGFLFRKASYNGALATHWSPLARTLTAARRDTRFLGVLRFDYSAGGAGQRLSLSRALAP
jgi:hypothetical protein